MTTTPDRLDKIYDRLGNVEKSAAVAHVQTASSLRQICASVNVLSERVSIQNGRVTTGELRLTELETRERIAASVEHEAEIVEDEQGERRAVITARVWALFAGGVLVTLGAALGYIL